MRKCPEPIWACQVLVLNQSGPFGNGCNPLLRELSPEWLRVEDTAQQVVVCILSRCASVRRQVIRTRSRSWRRGACECSGSSLLETFAARPRPTPQRAKHRQTEKQEKPKSPQAQIGRNPDRSVEDAWREKESRAMTEFSCGSAEPTNCRLGFHPDFASTSLLALCASLSTPQHVVPPDVAAGMLYSPGMGFALLSPIDPSTRY